MLTIYLLLFYGTQVHCGIHILSNIQSDDKLIQCVTGVIEKYFAETKKVTYVDISSDDSEILKAIHSSKIVSLMSRRTDQRLFVSNGGYLIVAQDTADFTENFPHLMQERTWNPYLRFLIIVRKLRENELENIFNALLRAHVNNVLLVNGTEDNYMYSYNPFEKNACGRYYDTIIRYGKYSNTPNTKDLYPNKVMNGLKNCTFSVTVPHRPPFAVDINQMEYGEASIGAEQQIFKELAKIEQFNIQFKYNYGPTVAFSTILPNMTAVGPMALLQNNETDIILGGVMLTVSRASAFTCLSGHGDYVDGFKFAVANTRPVPAWRDFYLEFNEYVWLLIILVFFLYSVIMIISLETKDKSAVLLKMLDNLLLHGYYFHSRTTVKCIFIVWMWFAYLINTCYQSNLFSITTHPVMEYQISNLDDVIRYQMKVCLDSGMQKFIFTENPEINMTMNLEKCNDMIDSVYQVGKSRRLFTIVADIFYKYYKNQFNDDWGRSIVYMFDDYYAKVILGIFFYKGFPIPDSMRINAIRMKDNGLMDKMFNDMYYRQKIKYYFRTKDYEARFAVPWLVYGVGCSISTAMFIIEVCLRKIKKK